jgi:tetratricopeptide (TPR) repeat protein
MEAGQVATEPPEPPVDGAEGASGDVPFDGSPELRKMAESCFNSADEAARRNNYDYAIKLYSEGLRYTLDDVERGHKPLYETALRRRATGRAGGWSSKTATFKSNMLQMAGKKKDAFVSMEEAMTGTPESYVDLRALALAAFNLGLKDTPVFFIEQAMEMARKAGKLSEDLFVQAAKIYEGRSHFRQAMVCLQEAEKLDKLNTQRHMKRIRDLAARVTMEKTRIAEAESFRDQLLNAEQAKESAGQKVRTVEDELIERADKMVLELKQQPNDLNLMIRIGDTYARASADESAMKYYRQARAASGGADYRIKVKMDDLTIRDYRTKLRALDEKLLAAPGDPALTAERVELIKKRDQYELEVYTERSREYPTDMSMRYELGRRLYRLDQIEGAIGAFQMALRDPKHKIVSLNMLGKCFFNRKMHQEAAAQFRAAITAHEFQGDDMWKELRYNLGLTYEAMKQLEKAIGCYSEIVMLDFQYRDAAKRLQELRAKLEGDSNSGPVLPDE